MRLTIALLGAAGALALAALPLEAAPAVDAAALRAEALVEAAAYRRCWVSEGRRQCRWVEERIGGYQSQERPEAYATGSSQWWRAMDRESRGGFRK
jgi:hypothetical protein